MRMLLSPSIFTFPFPFPCSLHCAGHWQLYSNLIEWLCVLDLVHFVLSALFSTPFLSLCWNKCWAGEVWRCIVLKSVLPCFALSRPGLPCLCFAVRALLVASASLQIGGLFKWEVDSKSIRCLVVCAAPLCLLWACALRPSRLLPRSCLLPSIHASFNNNKHRYLIVCALPCVLRDFLLLFSMTLLLSSAAHKQNITFDQLCVFCGALFCFGFHSSAPLRFFSPFGEKRPARSLIWSVCCYYLWAL